MLNTDIRPTADRYTTDSWPTYNRQLTDTPPRYNRLSINTAVDMSTDTRPIVGRYIDRLSTDSGPTIRLWTDIYIEYWPTLDWYIDRYIGRECLQQTWSYFIGNSPYYLPYNSWDVSLENLELDQPIIP